MTAELLVNVTPSETRVAYIDGGILQEIHIEREARRGIVGNIYKGRVSRVLPGMQAAFVDIGLDKAAFLHASDIMPHTECVAGEEQKQFTVRDISELVRQDLMVQVVKDPLGTKGARLTTDITLPSRYLVFMPGASHVGVSQRIESEAERERLKRSSQNIAMSRAGLSFAPLRKVFTSRRWPPMPLILSAYGPR
ncbi:ribonuclease E/G [Klebsiella pneumoniae]|nr:ribonuclease E/G [Klebsiella pneumoniae]